MAPLLEIQDLVTNFTTYEGVVRALNKVSLVVDHGMTFGLVGESGCGKSVTVRSIMRIVQEPGRIESGKIILYLNDDQGVNLVEQSEAFMESMRGDQISMIFQEPNAALNPTMTIGRQVAESFLFHRRRELARLVLDRLHSGQGQTLSPGRKVLQPIYRICLQDPLDWRLKICSRIPLLKLWQRPMVREALKLSIQIMSDLGIPNAGHIARQYPHNLSGGMKQRVVIAIALACDPLMLIADEATSNLDVTIQAQILELLVSLKKQKAISSILLITHDLGVVAETCDRVGVMYAGNLCEVADVRDLFQNPRHPYTRALLDAVPKLKQEGELQSIEGNVPNLVDPPPGCRFNPRCPHAMPVCAEVRPELTQTGRNHFTACHLMK